MCQIRAIVPIVFLILITWNLQFCGRYGSCIFEISMALCLALDTGYFLLLFSEQIPFCRLRNVNFAESNIWKPCVEALSTFLGRFLIVHSLTHRKGIFKLQMIKEQKNFCITLLKGHLGPIIIEMIIGVLHCTSLLPVFGEE